MTDRDTQTAEVILLSVGKAAALLGVSLDTVRRWTDKGALHAVRTPGGQRRYRQAEVLALRETMFGDDVEPVAKAVGA